MAGRLMQTAPAARLACVTVIKTNRLRIDNTQDELGRNLHVRRLVEMRQWAGGLGLAPEQVTAHVLEAIDPAAALIDFARENHVDQMLIGAGSPRRRSIGPHSRPHRRPGPLHRHAGPSAASARSARTGRGGGDGAGNRVGNLAGAGIDAGGQ